MSIKTSRAEGVAEIRIDYAKCNACGLCVAVCKGKPLYIENRKLMVDQSIIFGCIACGHCAAICPRSAISVSGRCMSPEDFIPIPPKNSRASYEQIKSLFLARRSTREFRERAVPEDIIRKIIDAASGAPMGIPPSDVGVLVLRDTGKVQKFAGDFIAYLKKIKWIFSRFMLYFWRPFVSREDFDLFRQFLIPLAAFLIETREKGEDWLLYNAPAAVMFYGTLYTDPADSYIAATYAMIAAESLGIGSCMIGSVFPIIQYGARDFKKKYNLPKKMRSGIIVIFGYPKYEFKKAIRRSLARVEFF